MNLSIDDGCASDLRAADLAERYEIKAIFYWPVEWQSLAHDNGYQPLDYEQAMRISQKHEVGSHTITHRHLTKIDMVEACKEILGSQFMLRRMFNQNITKFAPPRGYTNDELTDFTAKFYQSQRLTKGENLVHIHPNSGANNNRPWQNVYHEKVEQGIDVELWGHSWEWDRFNMWEEIEGFLNERSRS